MIDQMNAYLQHLKGENDVTVYDYQVEVARSLFDGKNVIARVPTGCGKTWAAIIPFLMSSQWKWIPARLIYVLPMRTLIESIADLLRQRLVNVEGWHAEDVSIQTGTTAEAPFLIESRIVVTTFDQLLSGLLGDPYSLGPSLHNINSASLVGTFVVFDEFHLMPVEQALFTAMACCRIFGESCQSLWMTATAPDSICHHLRDNLHAEIVELSENDSERIPALQSSKSLHIHNYPLTAEEILAFNGTKLVVVNQVGRAQALYQSILERDSEANVVCLHSRFFAHDRESIRHQILDVLGPAGSHESNFTVIATQVVEAGLDISADYLLTEIAPANSIIQRAGRCARYGGVGEVHVYNCPEECRWWLPYGTLHHPYPTLECTQQHLSQLQQLNFETTNFLVNAVHGNDGLALNAGLRHRIGDVVHLIIGNNFNRHLGPLNVNPYIRDADISVNLIIEGEDCPPTEREGIRIDLNVLLGLVHSNPEVGLMAWTYDENGNGCWQPVGPDNWIVTYHYRLHPNFANYTPQCGLVLGESGSHTSPVVHPPEPPGHCPAHIEYWGDHAHGVAESLQARLNDLAPGEHSLVDRLLDHYGITRDMFTEALCFAALAHDLGKLQQGWQDWARAVIAFTGIPPETIEYPLAHTPSHGNLPVEVHRPQHSLQGAYLAYRLLCEHPILRNIPNVLRLAVVCAIASHHGGWIHGQWCIQPLAEGSEELIRDIFGLENTPHWELNHFSEFIHALDQQATHPDTICDHWPLTSLIIRILRLSDQEATSEGG